MTNTTQDTSPEDTSPPPVAQTPGVRLWPAALILALGAAALAIIWFGLGLTRGWQVIYTYAAVGATFLLLLVWAAFFSRLPARQRWLLAGLPVLAVAVFFALVKVEDVDGDMWLSFTWRWTPKPHERLATQTSEWQSQAIELTPTPDDFPQFLGQGRNATVEDARLARDWKAHPPKLVWKRDIGAGWSGFAVVGDYAFTQEQRGEMEMVTCYELLTGKPVWRHKDKAGFISTVGGDGPRATPTVANQRVYAAGATGLVTCLDARSGKLLWQTNVLEQFGAGNTKWGHSGSPLVVGGKVVVTGGGKQGPSLIALAGDTGKVVWQAGDIGAIADSYASPSLAKLDGVEQILLVNDVGVTAHDPETGRKLWSLPWPLSGAGNPKIAQPVILPDDQVLLTWAYTAGTVLLKIHHDAAGAWQPEIVWKNRNLRAKFSNVVVHGQYAYGLDDRILTCIDWKSGKRKWKKRSGAYGHGQILLAGDLILVLTEEGEIALVEATPEDHRELGRIAALGDKSWNTLALSGPYLLARNDRQSMCFKLALEETP